MTTREEKAERDAEMRRAYAAGVPVEQIAAECGLAHSTVLEIVRVSEETKARVKAHKAAAAARRSQMKAMRATGASLDQIGEEFGVTRERVRQVLTKAGGYDTNIHYRMRREAKAVEIRKAAAAWPLLPLKAFGDDKAVRAALSPEEYEKHKSVQTHGGRSSTYPNATILQDIKDAFARSDADSLSLTEYNRLRGPDSLSGQRVFQRFGSWQAATKAAGVPMGKSRKNYTRKWSDEEMLAFLARFLDESPRLTWGFFDRWTRDTEGVPSSSLFRLRLGTWAAMRKKGMHLIRERADADGT